MVPTLSMAFMAVSILVSVGLPIALYIFMWKKHGAKFIPLIVGVASFILFALILEQIAHMLVLRPDADGNIALRGQPILYMLYGGFAAGIFEETGRFVSYRLIKRRMGGVQDAISYGIGHGGIEAVLIVGIAMLNNLLYSFMINSGGFEAMTAGVDGATLAQMQAAVVSLETTPSYYFLLAGFERVCAIAIHIALSVIVYCSVFGQKKWWLYPAAILLHAVIDFPAALMQAGMLNNLWVVEGLVLLAAAALVAVAVFVYRRWGRALPMGGEPELQAGGE